MMGAAHVDTVFSGTTMVLLIMQGERVSACAVALTGALISVLTMVSNE